MQNPQTKPSNNTIQTQMTQAFIYFSKPLPIPIIQADFEHHLQSIGKAIQFDKVRLKILTMLVQRYHQIVSQSCQLEQYLLIQFIQTIKQYISKIFYVPNLEENANIEQVFIVLIWATVSHLKNMSVKKQNREIVLEVISAMNQGINFLKERKSFKMTTIYPQISSSLVKFITEPVDYVLFRDALKVMGELLLKVLEHRKQIPKIISMRIINQKNNGYLPVTEQQKFDNQCVKRLQYYFKAILQKIPTMQTNFKSSLLNFLHKIKSIAFSYSNLLVPYSMLVLLSDGKLQEQGLSASEIKLIKSSITNQFIQIISSNSSSQSKANILSRLIGLSPYLCLESDMKIKTVVELFLNRIYVFHNNHSLVVPHNPIAYSTHLIELTGQHSFSDYNVTMAALIQSYDFEIKRFLVTKLTYAQIHLPNIESLVSLINNLSDETLNVILEELTEKLLDEQSQYMIDMSLTKLSQLLTQLILVYWIVSKPNYRPPLHLAQSLFDNLVSSQGIRILSPSFKQQQILISLTVLICYLCYLKTLVPSLTGIKRMKKKINLLEITINNIFEDSYLIKLATYFILLTEAAPGNISNLLENLQSTLINRNLHHLKFIIALSKICRLADNQCQDLAEKIMINKNYGGQQLLNIIFPQLDYATMRRCLLCTAFQNGKWVYMLLNNGKRLYNKQISQNQANNAQIKLKNFYMNDGANVVISNALGVIILQLKQKWQYSLNIQCSTKQSVVDLLLEILNLNNEMVFFKFRFSTIFRCLLKLYSHAIRQEGGNWLRIQQKICRIIQKLPIEQIKSYTKTPTRLPEDQDILSNFKYTDIEIITEICSLMQKRHKKYQLQYLTCSNKQNQEIYNLSETVIQKLNSVIN